MNVLWDLKALKRCGWSEASIKKHWLKDLKSYQYNYEGLGFGKFHLIWNDGTETIIPMSQNNKYIGLPDDYTYPSFSHIIQELVRTKER